MRTEREYVIDTLEAAGIRKSCIYTTLKRLRTANEMRVGGVLQAGEHFERSSSKTKYTDQEGQRVTRWKVWSRETRFQVVIADSTDDKVEEVLVNFLLLLKKGIDIDQNWTGIEVSDIDWVEADDSILKSKVAIQFQVIFHGGVYRDSNIKTLTLGEVTEDRQEE